MIIKTPTSVRASQLILISLLLCLLPGLSAAGSLYKWVDEDGQVRYSDRMPSSQIKQKHEKLSPQGVVIGTKEAAKSEEELAAANEAKAALEAKQALERIAKEEQDRKDRVLILTFSSEEEMSAVRENRIAVIDSVINLIQKSIDDTEEKLVGLKENAEVNYTSKDLEIPGGLEQKIEFFTRRISLRTDQLNLKEVEKQKLIEQFDLDMARYRLLKGQ